MASAAQGFTFGSSAAPSSGFGFGATQATSQPSAFGGFGNQATSTPGFGFASATPSSAAGTGLGFGSSGGAGAFGTGAAAQNVGFGGLGTGGIFGGTTGGLAFGASGAFKSGLGTLGTPQNQVANVPGATSLMMLKQAITNPCIFGDDRDQVLTKWNQLQSCWGIGKGFYNQQGASVDFTFENPYALLKAVGYSCISDTKNEDGLVNLVFGRGQDEVFANQQQIVDGIHKLLGSRTNLIVCVDSIKSILSDKCEMTMYVQDRQVTGSTTRIPASELFTYLNQQSVRQQISSQLCIQDVHIKVAMTKEQLKYYLENPPAGIDHRIWEQAKLDNPDPDKLLPVPIVGFSELHRRLKYQDQQTQMHRLRLDVISSNLSSLKSKFADMTSKIDEFKRRQVLMSHRVLQVMVKQEIARKQGYAIQPEEEQLSTQLEAIAAELNAPTQFKGRLNELMSQIRMQNQTRIARSDVGYQINEEVQQEIKQHLKKQQEGITHLIQIIREDLHDLKIVEQSLADSSKLRR